MAQAQDTPTHYKVALALGRHADGNNTHDHSLRWLAKESVKSGQDAVSVRTLVNHLLCFEETGAICVVRRPRPGRERNDRNVYVINIALKACELGAEARKVWDVNARYFAAGLTAPALPAEHPDPPGCGRRRRAHHRHAPCSESKIPP
jgi:hypothetical protein